MTSVAHAARQGRRRIGYVSSDLRRHAVGYVMAELFDHHDASEFEIFVYYCGIPVVQDPIQDRIKAAVEHWVDVRAMDDETFAQRCYDDGIDILIDVNGYTMDAKTKAFALRPAPIIVNWLGYPGTMGSPYHHYIIADEWIIPKGSEVYYSETVLRLPCYQPNDRKRTAAATPSRVEAGLPETGFVFCSFNNIHKIAAHTFDRWMAILSRVPGSVIWLLGSTEDTHNRLRDRARLRGVDPDRLIFRPTLPNADHIARYPLADLLLDTAPYGAHVTASDALWMGLPILTFSGHSFAARVCGSLVRSAGLGEMVCSTPEEFVERAVALANAPDELRRLKEKLAANRDTCVLFDIANLTRHLEGLFRDMWKDFMEGKTPRPDFTNMETYLEIGAEHDHDANEVQAIRDLQGLYKRTLEARHRYAAIAPDTRLWTEDDIKAAERHP
jgi:predicted O-linked N-acetylglucosamine transferase (SPINDLY family)